MCCTPSNQGQPECMIGIRGAWETPKVTFRRRRNAAEKEWKPKSPVIIDFYDSMRYKRHGKIVPPQPKQLRADRPSLQLNL